MRVWIGFAVATFMIAAMAATAAPSWLTPDAAAHMAETVQHLETAQDTDEEVPPGNPVIGDTRPGDVEDSDTTNYLLWGLVGVCLIGAGLLLVKLERWEANRTAQSP